MIDMKRIGQHQNEIARRWPEALPNFSLAGPISRAGHIITPRPVAIEVGTTPAKKEAMETAGEKRAHALYYREMKRIMQPTDRFFAARIQTQKVGAETLTTFFQQLLPDITMGSRPNIKGYGHRFMYVSGCKPVDGLFVFAAQFGFGMLCWGMVLGSQIVLSPTNDALSSINWRAGGGIGSTRQASRFDYCPAS